MRRMIGCGMGMGGSVRQVTIRRWVHFRTQPQALFMRNVRKPYGRFAGSDVATLLDLAVSHERFGQGLGKFLVLQCARRLREQRPESCREVVLYTLRHWSRAVGLYCRLGFRFQ